MNLPIEIEIDGGVDEDTIVPCVEAGATIFVAGSAIFDKADRAEALKRLKRWRKSTTKMKYAVVCAGGPKQKLRILRNFVRMKLYLSEQTEGHFIY